MTCLKWPKLKYNQKILRDKEGEGKIKWEGGRGPLKPETQRN